MMTPFALIEFITLYCVLNVELYMQKKMLQNNVAVVLTV